MCGYATEQVTKDFRHGSGQANASGWADASGTLEASVQSKTIANPAMRCHKYLPLVKAVKSSPENVPPKTGCTNEVKSRGPLSRAHS
jgi:hypothetical protein